MNFFFNYSSIFFQSIDILKIFLILKVSEVANSFYMFQIFQSFKVKVFSKFERFLKAQDHFKIV